MAGKITGRHLCHYVHGYRHYNVRNERYFVKRTVYIAIEIDISEHKDVFRMYVVSTEETALSELGRYSEK